MRTTLSCARRVLSLSVAAALGSPVMAVAAPPVVADGTSITIGDETIAGAAGQHLGHAMQALNGGSINATGMTLSTSGDEAHAAYATGAASAINLDSSTITTSGYVGSGLVAADGGQINAEGVQFTSTGNNGRGITSSGAGSVVHFKGGSITTNGAQFADGVRARDGGTVNIGRDNTGNGSVITIAGGAWAGIAGGGDAGSGTLNVDGATLRGLAGLLAQGSGAALNVSDSTIETRGVGVSADAGSHAQLQAVTIRSGQNGRNGGTGVKVENGAHVDVIDSSISTLGNLSHGVHAQTGGTASVSNTSIVTSGGMAYGILVDGTGSRVEMIGGSIHTSGESADGVKVSNGGSALVDGSVITTSASGLYTNSAGAELGGQLDVRNSTLHNVGSQAENQPTHGVDARNAGTVVNVSDTLITMEGRRGSGLFANENGVLSAVRTTVNTSGNLGHGILMGAGTRVSIADSDIRTSGDFAHGVAVTGGQFSDSGSRISTTGLASSALYVAAAQANADVRNSLLSTSGKDAHAVWVDAGGTASIANSQLATTGGAARGINATNGSQVTIADSSIRTSSGELRDAHGVYANGGSGVSVSNVEITTEGARSRGLLADAATIGADRVSIFTTGSESIGVLGINAAAISLDNAAINTSGAGGHGVAVNTGSGLVLDGATVETAGDSAFGVIVRNDGSHADLQRLQILTHGSNAIGLSVDYGSSSAALVDSQITTEGAGSHAARVQDGAMLDVSNSVLKSDAAAALLLNSGTLTASDGAAIEGNGTLAQFGSDAVNTLVFDRNVVALGDVRFADGASDVDGSGALDRTSTLSLDNNSYWKGATDAVGDLSLANGSRWDVTGNSNVGSLSLLGSAVVFDHSDGQYKSLTIDGNFHADNGLLAMNTALGDDDSMTDLLHVKGDTSGNAKIAVNNIGGTGAQTEDGIKLVQVDGVSAGEYALAGRAVGGAYEYFMYQGGHSNPNDGDWYLRSELSPVEPPVDPCDGGGCTIDPPVDPTPVFRPEGGAYLANQAAALGLFNMDLHERVGEPNLAQRQRGDGNLGSAWARVTTDQPRYRVNDQLNGQGRQNVVQLGSDLTFWGSQDRGVIGIMASSGQATHRVTSSLTGYAAEGRVDGRALGVYSTWIQDAEDDDGLYIDGWLQAAQFKNYVQGDALTREQYRSRSLSASVEAGYALRLHQSETRALYLEPQVQAIWTDYRMDGGQHQEVNGTVVKTAEAGGLQTRVGARLYGHSTDASGNRVQPFIGVNWIRNGDGANAVWMGEQRLQGIVPKNAYEAKAGAQMQLSPNLTGWGELNVQKGDYGFRSVGGQLGVKYVW